MNLFTIPQFPCLIAITLDCLPASEICQSILRYLQAALDCGNEEDHEASERIVLSQRFFACDERDVSPTLTPLRFKIESVRFDCQGAWFV